MTRLFSYIKAMGIPIRMFFALPDQDPYLFS